MSKDLKADYSEYYSRAIDLINNKNRFSGANDIVVDEIFCGGAKGSMEITERLLNPHSSMHGGALSTLADTVAGISVVSIGYTCVTLNNTMNYLRQAHKGKVYCKSKITKAGRKITVCDIEITDDDDRLISTGTYTFYITGKIEDMV